MKSIDDILGILTDCPETTKFEDVIAMIDDNYSYVATRFSNGLDDDRLVNEAGQNEGSCKIFAFAKLHDLDVQQTLHCFGRYYRNDVLSNPAGDDHLNIRNFMKHGWNGIHFDGEALR